eukprot:4500067-Prorocentrum_lima.AAC.1
MTSSLVGSEMCIRDRGVQALLGLILVPLGLLCFGTSDHTHGAARPVEPVSYTHLTLPTICSV